MNQLNNEEIMSSIIQFPLPNKDFKIYGQDSEGYFNYNMGWRFNPIAELNITERDAKRDELLKKRWNKEDEGLGYKAGFRDGRIDGINSVIHSIPIERKNARQEIAEKLLNELLTLIPKKWDDLAKRLVSKILEEYNTENKG